MTLETRVPTLDLLLGGGTPQGDMFLLVGPTGSGTSGPALRAAPLTAARGRDAVCGSTLSETPPRRPLRRIESFSFRDIGQPGKRLSVLEVDRPIGLDPEAATDARERQRVAEDPKW